MPSCWDIDGGVVYPDTGVYPVALAPALAPTGTLAPALALTLALADEVDDADGDDDATTAAAAAADGKKGLLVGPAIGRVGAEVFDNVTTRLRPSQPVDDNRSIP